MKKLFILIQIFIFSLIANASNESNFNQFEKFELRLANVNHLVAHYIIGQDNHIFNSQLNAGNYLSFNPDRIVGINVKEFISDVLQEDYYTYELTKKGKEKNKSVIYKFDSQDFFNNYQSGVKMDRVEMKNGAIVLAEIKQNGSQNEYKIVRYGLKYAIIGLPLNSAHFLKKISDTEIIIDKEDKYSSPEYYFVLENNKLVIKDKKKEVFVTVYREGDSLFLDYGSKKFGKQEIRVNKELSQIEYYKNGKITQTMLYKILD